VKGTLPWGNFGFVMFTVSQALAWESQLGSSAQSREGSGSFLTGVTQLKLGHQKGIAKIQNLKLPIQNPKSTSP
jgi:hypothetical protein